MPLALKLKRNKTSSGEAASSAARKSKPRLKLGRKPHFVLFVGDEGAILIFLEGNAVQRRLFAPTAAEEHTRTMIELMGQHPDAPLRIVMDVIDQQYVKQTFPPVSALSVGGLVARRLQRDFAAEDLCGSIRIGREATARKDWVYLLVALINSANYQQWTNLMIEQPNRLLGVYLTPVEGEQFLCALDESIPRSEEIAPAAWKMLIAHHKVSGFRIIVLRDGKLAFTRVGQAVGDSLPAVLAGNVEQEILNTIEYIRRLGYHDAAGLDVYAIVSAEVRDSIEASRLSVRSINLLSPFDVADLLGLKQAALAADRFGDVVMGSAIGLLKKSALVLKPAYAKKLDMLWQARMGARAFAVLAMLVCVGLSGKAVYSALHAGSQTGDVERRIAADRSTLSLLQKQVEGLGVDINLKSDVANFFEVMQPDALSPIEMVPEVAGIRRPKSNIKEWTWASLIGAGVDAAQPAAGQEAPKVQAEATLVFEDGFVDNQAILDALTAYKDYLDRKVTRYAVELPGVELTGGQSKVSVALPGMKTKGGGETLQAPTLRVVLKGPLPETAPPASAAGGTP